MNERKEVDARGDIGAGEFEGFYVVLRDDDMRLHRHAVDYAAVKEAERLAGANPGHRFIVLAATEARRVERPITVEKAVFVLPF